VSTPTAAAGERAAALRRAIRCFDGNQGRSFAEPTTDPHGRPLRELTDDELRERRAWCLLPEYHDALVAEQRRRLLRDHRRRTGLGG
jgi:hypothetical protein